MALAHTGSSECLGASGYQDIIEAFFYSSGILWHPYRMCMRRKAQVIVDRQVGSH